MGVKGLTTYLREHRLSTSKTVELFANVDSQPKQLEMVVDGWSFIYVLYRNAKIPWVYGGEYDRFSTAIERVVCAWLKMGINLSFVFDGPKEPAKFPTCISRLTDSNVKTNAIFFRTSLATRVTPRFLSETSVLPPLAYAACVETLLALSTRSKGPGGSKNEHGDDSNSSTVTPFPLISSQNSNQSPSLNVYFADREGDPFMVELAGRLEAYVTALDSDFAVFNVVGYKGYIPLDEFVWTASTAMPDLMRTRTLSIDSDLTSLISSADLGSDSSLLDAMIEDDFVPVKRKRSRVTNPKAKAIIPHPQKPGTLHKSLVPPDEVLSLTFPVYTPSSVAQSLGITPALLPLLGSIVGNDFTNSEKVPPGQGVSANLPRANHQEFLFEHKMNASQRIIYTANTLSTSLRKLTLKSKQRGKVSQTRVLDLIRNTVNQMLLRPGLTTESEVENIVNKVVEGALTYAIAPATASTQGLWPTDFCPLHGSPEQCRLDAFLPESDVSPSGQPYETVNPLDQVQRLYLRAYREGSLDPNVLDILISGTMWPRMFLESPDLKSRSGPDEAGGVLRGWVYAILEQGIGIYIPPQEEDEDDSELQPPDEPDHSRHRDHQVEGPSTQDSSQEDEEEDSDDDEVVDVVDDDEGEADDPLSALKGALQRLRGYTPKTNTAGDGLPTIRDQESESERDVGDTDGATDELEPCYVGEYVRRGVRIAEVRVTVEDLNILLERKPLPGSQLPAQEDSGDGAQFVPSSNHPDTRPKTSRAHPIQLEQEAVRFNILLSACASNIEEVRQLEPRWLGPVLIARWLVQFAAATERDRESQRLTVTPLMRKWTKGETAAMLYAFDPEMRHGTQEEDSEIDRPAIQDRPIQLMAQLLSVIESFRMLIQVLGLNKRVPINIAQFKGRLFHQTISDISTRTKTLDDISNRIAQSSEIIWTAVESGLEGCFGEDRIKRAGKKEAPIREGGNAGNLRQPAPNTAKLARPTKGSLFNLLREINPPA